MENDFGIKGYVNLSVFNNPGGSADQACSVTSSFFPLDYHPRGTNLDATLERKSSANPSVLSGGVTFTGLFKDLEGEMFRASFIVLIFNVIKCQPAAITVEDRSES